MRQTAGLSQDGVPRSELAALMRVLTLTIVHHCHAFGGSLNRRHFLKAAASLPLAAPMAGGLVTPARADAAPFDRSVVRQLARDAAAKPYKAPDTKLPDNLKNLDYDHYRQIRFLPEHALWRSEKLPFQVQFFHRGFFYEPRVDIYEVANGQATKIVYRPD